MGQKKSRFASPEEKASNDKIDSDLNKSREEAHEIIKLLLLGAGESGKSTLFKQMVRLYGNGFSDKDHVLYIPMVHTNTIAAMNELCVQSDIQGRTVPECIVRDPAAVAAKNALVHEVKAEDKITPRVAGLIETLWKDPGIRRTYELRSRFQLMDSADYFFAEVQRISQPNYIPTDNDLIRCRVRTTGIVENRFTIDDNQFLMVDVGGQRNERKKWIHCFEGVTAVIYVAALSEYDMVLYEDGQTNRMDEALRLFKETTGMKWFQNTSFLVFLNKRDLFEEKLKRVPLSTWALDYKGDNSFASAVDYIKKQFESRSGPRKLYIHITTATDETNVAAVFTAVKDIIIQTHLRESGLI